MRGHVAWFMQARLTWSTRQQDAEVTWALRLKSARWPVLVKFLLFAAEEHRKVHLLFTLSLSLSGLAFHYLHLTVSLSGGPVRTTTSTIPVPSACFLRLVFSPLHWLFSSCSRWPYGRRGISLPLWTLDSAKVCKSAAITTSGQRLGLSAGGVDDLMTSLRGDSPLRIDSSLRGDFSLRGDSSQRLRGKAQRDGSGPRVLASRLRREGFSFGCPFGRAWVGFDLFIFVLFAMAYARSMYAVCTQYARSMHAVGMQYTQYVRSVYAVCTQ